MYDVIGEPLLLGQFQVITTLLELIVVVGAGG